MSEFVITPVQDEVCEFDPIRDFEAVSQTGFVDLKAANVSSSIPAIDGLSEEHYNGIEDPRSIGARPSDDFEAMQANKAIVGYKAPAKNESSVE